MNAPHTCMHNTHVHLLKIQNKKKVSILTSWITYSHLQIVLPPPLWKMNVDNLLYSTVHLATITPAATHPLQTTSHRPAYSRLTTFSTRLSFWAFMQQFVNTLPQITTLLPTTVGCRILPPTFHSSPLVSLLSSSVLPISAPPEVHLCFSFHIASLFPFQCVLFRACVRALICSSFQPCNMVQNLVRITSEYEAAGRRRSKQAILGVPILRRKQRYSVP